MAFRTNAAPYQRAKNSTLKIMLILFAALAVVWVFGIVYSFKLEGLVNEFVKLNNEAAEAYNTKWATQIANGKREAMAIYEAVSYGLKSILMVVVALATTAVCDVVTTLLKHKKNSKESLGKEIVNDLIHNYSWVTAIIFALTIPVYTSYFVIIVGSVFATVVVKNFFGGFGKNIFNPAIMARIFVGLCFGSQLMVPDVLLAGANSTLVESTLGIDAITGATLTGAYNNAAGWLSTTQVGATTTIFGSIFSNFTLVDMLTGNYVGALGETFTIVIFALGIILSVLKVINWRTPVFYLGTVALTSLVIALVLGLDSPLTYVLYHLSLGGVMFGAVFMLTDPVTGPTSSYGKSLAAVFAGLITVLIRIKGGYPEGVMFSIALVNFISPAIDYLTVGKTNSHLLRKACVVCGTLLVSIGLCTGISYSVNNNGYNDSHGREVYQINNIDVVEYKLLENALPLQEGHYFQEVENFEAKTANVKAYLVNKDTNESLDASYNIVDENGNVVAVAYSVYGETSIDTGGHPSPVHSYALVAIKADGTIYGVGALTPLNTKNYGFESSINEYANSQFTGKDATTSQSVDALGNCTYSSNFIKQLITYAYGEYAMHN